jgi:hypothetical protein
MEKLSNIVPTVMHLWKPIILRNPEDGDDTFSETSVRTSAACYKVPEASIIDTAVKASPSSTINTVPLWRG